MDNYMKQLKVKTHLLIVKPLLMPKMISFIVLDVNLDILEVIFLLMIQILLI